MQFYRERRVKKPRKQYRCGLCLKPIEGEHVYISGKWDDFITDRYHIECNEEAKQMCRSCEDSHDCIMDVGECFRTLQNEKKHSSEPAV